MDEMLRVSVRELVAFSYFSPDIVPGGNMADMLAGTKAHQAREAAQEAEFEVEKPLRCDVSQAGETVTVFGRMDAFKDGDPPCVEEIKLCREAPAAPLPDHVAQARLYGAMLALSEGASLVELRVVYVNAEGEPKRVFTEILPADTLTVELTSLLTPWLTFAVAERAHRQARDKSLRSLTFPFTAYRKGQRELAVQVYTAITRKKRLFASLPTGTGKSAAVLFPALKALGEGKTRKILYITARTTARQSPLNTLEALRGQGMHARVSTLLAKEKLCPSPTRCHPDDCPRAKGHYLRQPDAIQNLLQIDAIWDEAVITAIADEYRLCPFELGLALTELVDVVLMDVNYAFDPFVQIARLFKQRRDFTLLVDEAHHLLSRVRDSLSGTLDSRELRTYRTTFGKALGRKHLYYKQLTALINALRAIGDSPEDTKDGAAESTDGQIKGNTDESQVEDINRQNHLSTDQPTAATTREPFRFIESCLPNPPDNIAPLVETLIQTTMELLMSKLPSAECRHDAGTLLRTLCTFSYATEHYSERYATLVEHHGRERVLELFCLSPAEAIAATTKRLRGSVFFSATLSPLTAMRALLGGTEEDAVFSLPSPFSPERLAVVRKRIPTRYTLRESSAAAVAQSIVDMVQTRSGKYIVYFPSYAYLRLVLEPLSSLPLPPLLVQENDMGEDARARFLAAFTQGEGPTLGLCVLGGLFAEGIDLPGEQLIGVLIVGVGLPTPSLRLRTLQRYYQEQFGDGFLYAWMIPAMQKVLQAAGRVIRTETDKGIVVLVDERYYEPGYIRLLPPEWRLSNENIAHAAANLQKLEEL